MSPFDDQPFKAFIYQIPGGRAICTRRGFCFIFALYRYSYYNFKTGLFSRVNFKASKEETLGAARPQTCARVLRTLDPQLAMLHY